MEGLLWPLPAGGRKGACRAAGSRCLHLCCARAAPSTNPPQPYSPGPLDVCVLPAGGTGSYDKHWLLSEYECQGRCQRSDLCVAYEFAQHKDYTVCELHKELVRKRCQVARLAGLLGNFRLACVRCPCVQVRHVFPMYGYVCRIKPASGFPDEIAPDSITHSCEHRWHWRGCIPRCAASSRAALPRNMYPGTPTHPLRLVAR